MKKFITLIIAFMAVMLPLLSHASEGQSTTTPVAMDTHPIDNRPQETVHRAPIRIPLEVWYDAVASTISITYIGDVSGEVLIYRDGQLIDSSSEINTTFQVLESGLYVIEINTDSWTATGNFEI